MIITVTVYYAYAPMRWPTEIQIQFFIFYFLEKNRIANKGNNVSMLVIKVKLCDLNVRVK